MDNEQTTQDLGFHAYLRGIILIGFSLLLIAFILTGAIRYYIAPSMMPFVYFATVVFLLLGVIQIIRSTAKGQEEELLCDCGTDHSMSGSTMTKVLIYAIFVVPIISGFVVPDKVLDSSVAANRGVQFSTGMNQSITSGDSTGPLEGESGTSRAELFLEDPDEYYRQLEEQNSNTAPEDFYTEEGFNSYYREMADEMLAEDRLVVTDENYLDVMTMLEHHLPEFAGKEIELIGFVFRDKSFPNNQLAVARFGMTCCVADATVYATMIEADDLDELTNDMWVRVEGTLSQTEFDDAQIPLIHVDQLKVIDEPDSPYVFPSFRF